MPGKILRLDSECENMGENGAGFPITFFWLAPLPFVDR